MKEVERWLLPDGIEEMLPNEAAQVEALRRRLVNLFQRWGYDYVIPPMVEFTDSLLTGSGEDISLLTFKMTDQLSGKMLGLRADITPQVARMDAHSLKRDGINRLCYAGHVAHTRPKGPLRSRTPIQVGVELFGEAGLQADIEVISLLLNTLQEAGLPEQYLDLGHVGLFRELARHAGLTKAQEVALFELLQAKASSAIAAWLENEVSDASLRRYFAALPQLAGGLEVLDEAEALFADAPTALREVIVSALNDLRGVAQALAPRYPGAKLYFDLSELRGYHYLTGIVFGAFAPGAGTAIANGGRYDHVGEAFGRPRPATGFAVDLTAVRSLLGPQVAETKGIFAAFCDDEASWAEVQRLRDMGERVVCGLSGQQAPWPHQRCDRILEKIEGGFTVVTLDS